MILPKKCVTRGIFRGFRCQGYSKKSGVSEISTSEKDDTSRIRNIGILAHVDAGKTTTTERMLFYSGRIERMGEVHHGNTVTDFMDQERKRGITITSASVTFQWKNQRINLLDTPGHVDFTMEVEQTLNVMDGAIVILDGSAGVEAQTSTVWRQADKYKIPRIIYVNKMDKTGADFIRSLNSIEKHLQVIPVVLQLPIIKGCKFGGIIDVLSLEKLEWDDKHLGTIYSRKTLDSDDGKLWEDAVEARLKLTELLPDLDDEIAEQIIMDEKKILSNSALKESIRRIALERKGVPVLCGSSYKNIGVQLLMDAVIDYLPSPLCGESYKITRCFENGFCARAFKVKHDRYKGPITFFRIYSGSLTKGSRIYNVKQKKFEQCGKLFVTHADDYEEVTEIKAGNIAAVTGLKLTATGEMVTSSAEAFESARKAMKDKNDFLSIEAFVPDPVFFCSVEAPSERQVGALEKALSELEREDPSLRVTVNKETGQTVLGGMGELHLEIIKERIRSDYKVDATLGPLEIAYKEALLADTKGSHRVHHKMGSGVHFIDITMSVLVADAQKSGKLLLDRGPDCADNISRISPKHLLAVKKGIESALESGPKLLCPVANVNVMLHSLEIGRGTSESIITSASAQCVKKLLKTGGTRLLEPIMHIEIACKETAIEIVLDDLSRRRSELESIETRPFDVVVRALVPLSEIVGYSRDLRIMTSGSATLSMEFHSSRAMNAEEEAKAIKSVFGVLYS